MTAGEVETPRATYVVVSEDTVTVRLADHRSVSMPISWYPRLAHGSPRERNHWWLTGAGVGIHWLDLDED